MRNNSFASKGDAVIVTGAAGGIGAATVENLVNQDLIYELITIKDEKNQLDSLTKKLSEYEDIISKYQK